MADPLLIPVGFLALAGAGITASNAIDIWFGEASKHWPVVKARVVQAEIRTVRRNRWTTTAAVIRYTYRVGDREFESLRYAFSGRGAGIDAGNALDGRQIGDEITVRYDPANPGRACLVPGTGAWNYFLLLVGLIFLATAARFAAWVL